MGKYNKEQSYTKNIEIEKIEIENIKDTYLYYSATVIRYEIENFTRFVMLDIINHNNILGMIMLFQIDKKYHIEENEIMKGLNGLIGEKITNYCLVSILFLLHNKREDKIQKFLTGLRDSIKNEQFQKKISDLINVLPEKWEFENKNLKLLLDTEKNKEFQITEQTDNTELFLQKLIKSKPSVKLAIIEGEKEFIEIDSESEFKKLEDMLSWEKFSKLTKPSESTKTVMNAGSRETWVPKLVRAGFTALLWSAMKSTNIFGSDETDKIKEELKNLPEKDKESSPDTESVESRSIGEHVDIEKENALIQTLKNFECYQRYKEFYEIALKKPLIYNNILDNLFKELDNSIRGSGNTIHDLKKKMSFIEQQKTTVTSTQIRLERHYNNSYLKKAYDQLKKDEGAGKKGGGPGPKEDIRGQLMASILARNNPSNSPGNPSTTQLEPRTTNNSG